MGFLIPTVGSWYQDLSDSTLFEVVAVDEQGGWIEVQYESGDISEFEVETWGQLRLTAAAAPEDPNAGYGESSIPSEEGWDTGLANGYNNPLEFIEPDNFNDYDDFF